MLNLYELVIYYSDGEDEYPVDYKIVREATPEAAADTVRVSDERIDVKQIGWATGEEQYAGLLRH